MNFIGLTKTVSQELLMVNFATVKYYVSSGASNNTIICFIDGTTIAVCEKPETIDNLIKKIS